MNTSQQNRFASLLGLAGLVPFAVCAVAIWIPVISDFATTALIAYGAVILSFLGALHWGIALTHPVEPDADQRFFFSVIPALVAWVALLLPPLFALLLLLLAFIAVWLVERLLFKPLLPGWFLLLRAGLTVGVVLFLVVGLFARN